MTHATIVLVVTLVAILVAAAMAGVLVARARRAAARRRAVAVGAPIPRHPIVLVHGIFGWDELRVAGVRAPYFRVVADHLRRRGAEVFVPRLPPLGSVPERAERLAEFLRGLPAPRVNVIAHSMGGLDARWAISKLGVGDRVASLVTIGTPHRGSPIADVAASSAPVSLLRSAAARVGVDSAAVDWLTTAAVTRLSAECLDDPRVVYLSVVAAARPGLSSALRNPLLHAMGAFVRARAGTNDGLVPVSSQAHGEVVFEATLDHWMQIGWSAGADEEACRVYDDILRQLAERGL